LQGAVEVEEKIIARAEPLASALGMEIVDVNYVVEHGRRILRVYIDKPEGITVDDCADLSRSLSAALDDDDPIKESYNLEVSSPGLDRPLVKEKDFLRFVGHKAVIRTKSPIDGRKNFKVMLKGLEDGNVVVTDSEGRPWSIHMSNIDRARLEIEL